VDELAVDIDASTVANTVDLKKKKIAKLKGVDKKVKTSLKKHLGNQQSTPQLPFTTNLPAGKIKVDLAHTRYKVIRESALELGWKAIGFSEGFPKKPVKVKKAVEPLMAEIVEKSRPASA
jgi:uncharacterized protein YhbP (UPF0306 family)